MRHERFYILVGVFVVGALCLMLLGAAFFYEEYKRSQVQTFVMFFKGSLKGLVASAPVTYRGVKIGEVKVIEITENKARNQVRIPVYVQFFVEKTFGFSQDPIHLLINNGYVANISKPNFITGVAEVELIQSSSPRTFKQTYYHGYPIFPTQNTIEKYTTLDEALKAAKKTFEDISALVRSKEVRDSIAAAERMAQSIDQFTQNLNQSVPGVIAYLNLSLKQISNAAYSTQNLADYLSRYPESLLRGKR
ncbi:MlaD family protein [Legionella jordanis]|uniref:Putative transmembrane protein n=1 Tax=Legionella jordanis TaxID=456 RepID=A0A0W0VDZ9_9GAMM|nr:MlaD family protein [Legionella jordanis]KTD18303.1 putative transmembrane protein [Legionella jordanis]RMX05221.1 MCE family protein [Legionella jordanis]RMX20928.1 MCE family protein [Legionella jordanis]VEH13352.1 putative transmembrane protein [Legionella jordanis]HAT8713695.1 MCE family protein [Legionella jordanis]